ncbi:probable LRR receptor-like serine/threonine-protein kinase At1g14390 [Lycium ferocissimum]|uniref:probable LRR receptor-like serine/threonine-protein kinase At1g14390 n=1 Tax=Lycium ferocissimum TaxID=112874 RepID=UPI002815C571|nr:probable LRR receptor-like serine/threonine-protein kinase At1g14390 [Lycium ferocissimum]
MMRSFLFHGLLLFILVPFSSAQLVPVENRILFQIQQFLEYPPVLQGWNNWTNFCYLPQTPSLVITCSGNHITELAIVGNKKSASDSLKSSTPQALSGKFSIDSFFTVLTKLSSLKKLSLVSLGLWGPLPAKISRLHSLEVLNISSNFIVGEIPSSIVNFKNLKSLVLARNLFNGSVPDLKVLKTLEELDLSDNHLGPKFPSIGNNNNLVILNLSNNLLRSEIPDGLKKYTHLQILDFSSNKLVGPMPSFLFSLPAIQSISIAKNQLSGALPSSVSCSNKLKFVDVSSNFLVGKLPACLGSSSRDRTVINIWNCLSSTSTKYQHPHTFCEKQAIAVKPPSRTHDDEKKQSTVKLGVVLGLIAGIVIVIGAIGLLIFFVVKKVTRNRVQGYKNDSFAFEKNSTLSKAADGGNARRTMRMVSLGLPPYHVFTLEEMEEATNNFDPTNLVGEGSQGQLYRGWLRDGSVVLVKCLKLKQKHSPQILQQHMEMISKLRHRHLVSVLGHCVVTYQDHPNTASTVFVVLENVVNGSLKDHLSDWRKRDVLKWPQRMGITMGIAKGIQYLHTGGVTGNDIKLENVLLDETLTARISSYNISLPPKVGSESPLAGPDHFTSAKEAEKEDMYQLGVILLEAIIGRPINSQSETEDLKLQVETALAESPSKLRDLTDPCIRGTFAYDSLKTTVQIAINCLEKEPSRRPSVEDVLWHMQYSIQVQEGATNSGNLSGNLSGKLSGKISGNLNNKFY